MQNPDTINRRNLIAFFASLCLFLSVVMGNIQKDYGSMGKRWYARLKNWAFCYMITSKTKIITIVERKGW